MLASCLMLKQRLNIRRAASTSEFWTKKRLNVSRRNGRTHNDERKKTEAKQKAYLERMLISRFQNLVPTILFALTTKNHDVILYH